ncbi:MAG: hypothetical protein PHV32_07955 [Eubacteriales bacterium]|nr:hypothetical protein [Eubacteriales bacterium]
MEDKYAVKLLPRAFRDLDGIYEYIAETLIEPGVAAKLVGSLNTIFKKQVLRGRNQSILCCA